MARALFPYFGGKGRLRAAICSRLPRARAYYEPFCGSAAVFLEREPVSRVSLLNDADARIANVLAVARDREAELRRALELTVMHEADYLACGERSPDPVEDARRTLALICHARLQTAHAPRSSAFCAFWEKPPKRRADVALDRLRDAAAKLRRATVTCRPAARVIARANRAAVDALIYCDPPYPLATRVTAGDYGVEMTDADHEELLGLLLASPHRVAVSGYACDLYDSALRGWRREEFATITVAAGSGSRRRSTPRTEVLWRNYDLEGGLV